MKIGNIEIKDGIFFAPMAGVSDRAFREICRSFGAQMCFTEMISAKAVHYNDKKTAELAYLDEGDEPCAVQLFGHESEIIAEAAKKISENTYAHCQSAVKPAFIDINMGCPVKKIVNNGEGSALMKDPALVAKIVSAAVNSSTLPVTVKIRAGWNAESKNAVEIAQIAENEGAAAVTVHGRTREEMYGPVVDYDIIKECKKRLKIPVIANGGIMCGADAVRVLDYTGCDGIMVARGAQGNPFIFREITELLAGKEPTLVTPEERVDTAKKQLLLMTREREERLAVCEARKHISWYLRGMRGSSTVRGKINSAQTIETMFSLLDEILEMNSKVDM